MKSLTTIIKHEKTIKLPKLYYITKEITKILANGVYNMIKCEYYYHKNKK